MKLRSIVFGFAMYAALCSMPGIAGARGTIRMIFETSDGTNRTGSSQLATAGSGTIGAFEQDITDIVKTINPKLVSGLSGQIDSIDMAGIVVSGDGNELFFANIGTGTIGEYNIRSGTTNLNLVTGLSRPVGIALEGDDLFVVNRGTGTIKGTIGEYTTSGMTVNSGLIKTGLNNPIGIAVEGGNLFVANHTGTIGEFTTSGGTVNPALIDTGKTAGLQHLEGIAVGGGNLFVVDHRGTIGEYTTSGTLVNPALVKTGLQTPIGIAVDQGDLFVVDNSAGTIVEYDATTGKQVGNGPLVSGLNFPTGIAVFTTSTSVPEASSCTLLLFGLITTFGLNALLRRPAVTRSIRHF